MKRQQIIARVILTVNFVDLLRNTARATLASKHDIGLKLHTFTIFLHPHAILPLPDILQSLFMIPNK